MPPLTAAQIGQYLDSWLHATRPPGAPPLIFTVDAALILGHRAGGNLDQLDILARQRITTGGPVVASWDAWTAADDGCEAAGAAEPPVHPTVWPAPNVRQRINHRPHRRRAGGT